jgi:DNA-nicking Smr family endonuclease
MVRKLGADETALWSHVAASVRPIAGQSRPPLQPLPKVALKPQPTTPTAPKRTAAANRIAVDAATLDGSWDKAIRRGVLTPDTVIDLHGYTSDRAHDELVRRIGDAALSGARVLLVITGKGARASDSERGRDHDDRPRGVIRARLRDWLNGSELRPFIAALRPAHPRHGGGGAWYVILRRS